MMAASVRIYKDQANEWRWEKWSSSDRIATSGEGYVNFAHALRMGAAELPEGGVITVPNHIWVDEEELKRLFGVPFNIQLEEEPVAPDTEDA